MPDFGAIEKGGKQPTAKGQTDGKVIRERQGMNIAGKVENTTELPSAGK